MMTFSNIFPSRKYLPIFLFWVGTGLGLCAQTNISLHTDKSFYVTGERIWFSAYLLTDKNEIISSGDLLLSLYDPFGEMVQSARYPVKNGKSVGDLYLEETLSAGNYLLRFSSSEISTEGIFVQDAVLAVLAPSLLETINIPESGWQESFSGNAPSSDTELKVEIEGGRVEIREAVKLTLQLPEGTKGSYSVSVRDLSQLGVGGLPLLEGKLLKGSALGGGTADSWNLKAELSKQGGGLPPDMVNVYWAEQDTQILAKVTDGAFQLQLPKRARTQHFQVLDASPFPDHNFDVAWTQEEPSGADLPELPELRELSEIQKSYLYWFQRRKLVERLFQLNYSSPVENNGLTSERVKADKSYSSQKYLAFKDLEAFMKEVLSPAIKIQNASSGKTMRMLNFDSRVRFTQPPLVFLDGYLMKDISQIWEVNWNNVDYLELFGSHETLFPNFGPMGQGRGVIRLYTKGRQDFTDKIDLMPIYELEAYAEINQFQLPGDELDAPDLRPVLFWEGSLTPDDNGQLTISFPQSDLKGDFLVEVKGVQTDGTPFEAYHTYTVE